MLWIRTTETVWPSHIEWNVQVLADGVAWQLLTSEPPAAPSVPSVRLQKDLLDYRHFHRSLGRPLTPADGLGGACCAPRASEHILEGGNGCRTNCESNLHAAVSA